MKHSLLTFLLAAIFILPTAASAAPVEINSSPALKPAVVSDLDVSLRLIGGRGAVLMPGRDINLTFQTSSDAYVIIYNIDSEGYVHLLYPADGRPAMISGKKVHFLPEQGRGVTWEVGGDTGIEYIHAIAVNDPSRIDRDELYYLAQNSTMPEERRLRIDMDPFLAFNMIDEELIEDSEKMSPSTDYTYFYINRKVDYPGYLCYKCHSPSKIPDPYAMECPEVDIEMIAANEDAGYPYPQLFAVIQAGSDAPEDEYDSYTYYADNLSLGYDDYDYDEQKVYLSVYYSYGGYPYSYYWPGYYPWYVNWSSSWGWNSYWGIGWGWGGCYYHHYPFYSWYPYSYTYWHGYNHGYWDGYYGGGGYYPPAHYTGGNKRSIYAGREFTKRSSLDYASTRIKTSRDATIASSRLVKQRTKTATARSYQRSRLARQVTRDRASTGFRSFKASKYNTGDSERYKQGVYGNYGTSRSARTTGQTNKSSARAKSRSAYSEGARKSGTSYRNFDNRSTRSKNQTTTGRKNMGSELEKRVRERNSNRETRKSNTGTRRSRSYSPDRKSSTGKKSSTRSGTSARSTKDSGKSGSVKSNRSRTNNSPSRSSGAKKETKSSSPSRSSSGRSTTKSSSARSSGSSGRSSGRSSSGGKSSSGRRR
jgi:hypothetical protein